MQLVFRILICKVIDADEQKNHQFVIRNVKIPIIRPMMRMRAKQNSEH
jgi:hypothetical protein